MNDPVSNTQVQDELDLREIFRALWNTRRWVVIACLLATLAFVLGVGLTRFALPVHETYRAAVQFTFPQLEKDQYPSGAPFAITDITAPAVLQKVYNDNDLEAFGIGPEAFEQAISVRPYAPTYDDAARRYRQRLSDPDLTFNDQRNIEQDMEQELGELGANAALIEVQITDRVGLPPELGRKLATDIAARWSDFQIEVKNVLSLPIAASNDQLVTPDEVLPLDYPLGADMMLSASQTLQTRAAELTKLGGALAVEDPESGKNLLDLSREINQLATYRMRNILSPAFTLGISRDRTLAIEYFEQQLEQARFERDELATQAQAVIDSLALIGFQESPAGALPSAGGVSSGAQQVQVGSDIINQVLKFSNREMELKTRLELTEDLRDLRAEEARAEKRAKSLSSLLEALRAASTDSDGNRSERAELQKRIDDAMPGLIDSLNGQWTILNRLTHLISAQMTNHAASLYRPLALDQEVIRTHPVYSGGVLTLYLICVFVAALAAMLAHLVRQIVTSR